MKLQRTAFFPAICLLRSSAFAAAGEPSGEAPATLWMREDLTDNPFDLRRKLEQREIAPGLSLTQIYQNNARGPRKRKSK